MKQAFAVWSALLLFSALWTHASTGMQGEEHWDRIDDHRKKTSVSIIIVGDTGGKSFSEVAKAIVDHCKKKDNNTPCDFAILLGDNFYLFPSIIRPGPFSARSRGFRTRFYEPLKDLGPQFDVWAVLGNHGYLVWARPQAQIKHTYLPSRDKPPAPTWLLPDHVYEIPRLPEWLEIVTYDSCLVLKRPNRRDYIRWRVWEAYNKDIEDAGWRILASHHPFHTSGQHGVDEKDKQENLWKYIKSVIQDKKINVVLSGHDHHQELIFDPGTDKGDPAPPFIQVVQGAGSDDKRTQVRKREIDPLDRGAECLFFKNEQLGFGKMTFTKQDLTIDYFGIDAENASLLRSFTCVRGEAGITCKQTSHSGEESGCP